MINVDTIILSLYFPWFSQSSNSRFESFFSTLSQKKKKLNQNNNSNNLKIYPEKIIQGIDKRSSIEIRNIPKDWKRNLMKSIIESFGNINFLYICNDKTNNNLKTSTIFVNYINYKSIVDIFMLFRKISKNQVINVEVFYSKTQGKENLKKFFNDKNKDN